MAHTAGIFSDTQIDGPEIGTLVVIIDRAKNLPNRKTIGKQDPYCAVRLAKEAKKTKTDRRGGQTPRWDSEVRFTVNDSPDYRKLKVSCFSEDKRTELIGETFLDLNHIITPGGGKDDQWYELRCREKYAGEIRIELTYYDTRPPPEKPAEQQRKEAARNGHDSPAAVGGRRKPPSVSRRPLPEDPTRPVSIDRLNDMYDPALKNRWHDQHAPSRENSGPLPPSSRSSLPSSGPGSRNGSVPDTSYQASENRSPASRNSRSRLADFQPMNTPPHGSSLAQDCHPGEAPCGPVDSFPTLDHRPSIPIQDYDRPSQPFQPAFDTPPPPPRHGVSPVVQRSQTGYMGGEAAQQSQAPEPHYGQPTPQHHTYPTRAPDARRSHSDLSSHMDQMQLYDSNHVSYDEEHRPQEYDMPVMERVMSPQQEYTAYAPPMSSSHQAQSYLARAGRNSYSSQQSPYQPHTGTPPNMRPQMSSQAPSSYHSPNPRRPSPVRDYNSQPFADLPASGPDVPNHRSRDSLNSVRTHTPRDSQSWQPQHYDATYTPPSHSRRQSQQPTFAHRASVPITPSSLPNSQRNSYHSSPLKRNESSEQFARSRAPHRQSYNQPIPSPLHAQSPAPTPQASQTVKRKSVSPHPPNPSAIPSIPFGPDSFDSINPLAAASATSASGRNGATYKTAEEARIAAAQPAHRGRRGTGDEDAPIYRSDGKKIDPSDHLPSETWAPEPERKGSGDAVKHPAGARASPRGAQPLGKPAGAVVQVGGPATIHTNNPSPYSTSGKLQKRNPNQGARPGISPTHSSPVPLPSYGSSPTNARSQLHHGDIPSPSAPPQFSAQPAAQRSSYHGSPGNGALSTSPGGYGLDIYTGGSGGRYQVPPPIPAKVPEHGGYEGGYANGYGRENGRAYTGDGRRGKRYGRM